MNDNNYVEQGSFKIISKNLGPLKTSGLATCSAISFIINDTDLFMAHIDAKTIVSKIADLIKMNYKEPIDYTNVLIWYGGGFLDSTSDSTYRLINQFTNILGIPNKPIQENNKDILEITDRNIIKCKLCSSESGSLKIITHNFYCKYSFKTQIRTVGFMETVQSY